MGHHDFDQIAERAGWLRVVPLGALGFNPYARSFVRILFLYDYGAHRRRGGADRLRKHLTITNRKSPSPSARNRSDSYGGDTTTLTARRERSIAGKGCLSSSCHCNS